MSVLESGRIGIGRSPAGVRVQAEASAVGVLQDTCSARAFLSPDTTSLSIQLLLQLPNEVIDGHTGVVLVLIRDSGVVPQRPGVDSGLLDDDKQNA